MYLAIADDGVTLHLPDSVNDFYASYWARLTQERIAEVLKEHEIGELMPDGAHVMVRVAALRRLAEGRVPDGWDADFERMLARAGEKGWLSDDGETVQAHLERER